jgi:hypothetical protein
MQSLTNQPTFDFLPAYQAGPDLLYKYENGRSVPDRNPDGSFREGQIFKANIASISSIEELNSLKTGSKTHHKVVLIMENGSRFNGAYMNHSNLLKLLGGYTNTKGDQVPGHGTLEELNSIIQDMPLQGVLENTLAKDGKVLRLVTVSHIKATDSATATFGEVAKTDFELRQAKYAKLAATFEADNGGAPAATPSVATQTKP